MKERKGGQHGEVVEDATTGLVLFVCTANHFRSPFAEAVFNHVAAEKGLAWRAESRGIRASRRSDRGISSYTIRALQKRNIAVPETSMVPLTDTDLERSSRVIALNREEHETMMYDKFPRWFSRIDYWDIPDIDEIAPRKALKRVEEAVLALVDSLSDPVEANP